MCVDGGLRTRKGADDTNITFTSESDLHSYEATGAMQRRPRKHSEASAGFASNSFNHIINNILRFLGNLLMSNQLSLILTGSSPKQNKRYCGN